MINDEKIKGNGVHELHPLVLGRMPYFANACEHLKINLYLFRNCSSWNDVDEILQKKYPPPHKKSNAAAHVETAYAYSTKKKLPKLSKK